MLTQDQFNEYRRFKTLKEFFALNTAIFSGYVPFNDEVTLFNTNFGTLDGLVPNKEADGSGITVGKAELKKQAANSLAIIMRKTRAFALRYNLAELAGEMKTNATKIARIDDEDFQPYFSIKTGLITTVAIPDPNFAAYNVTAGDITAVMSIANAFKDLIGKAKNVSSTATTANTDIDNSIFVLQGNIIQFDLLIDHFKVSDHDFWEGCHINSTLLDLGVHHSGIEGIVRGPIPPNDPAEVPLNGVTIRLVGTNKSVISDLNGHYEIIKVKADDYQVEISKAGYKTITQVIHIRRGHVDNFDFVLQVA